MTPAERSLLRQFVTDARVALYRDFEQQLPGYGIFFELAPTATGALVTYTNVRITPPAELPNADRSKRALAARLQERLQYLRTTLPGTAPKMAEALPRLLLEQAYTFLNRLSALRMAEEREIVLECLRQGQLSEGFSQLFSLYTSQAYPTGDARYAAFIKANFDRLARELPGLYGAYSPYGLLWPRQTAFDQLLTHLRRPELAFAWDADETLGWLYQYFNSDAERQEMRRASPRAPRNSREMAVRNQFFTPRYVVEFLTDNALGRRWRDLTGDSEALRRQCRYLMPEEGPAEVVTAPAAATTTPARRAAAVPTEVPDLYELPDPRSLRALDPACGSMHFGLYAFDVFETIYLDAWDRLLAATVLTDIRAELEAEFPEDPEAQRKSFQARIPGLILTYNLHGVDIDPRAIQVAGLTLWLRAHRSWQRLRLRASRRPRVQEARLVWAEPLPLNENLLGSFAKVLRQEILPGQERPLAPAEAQVLADLLGSVAQHTRLVGEAGWLVPLEQELASLIETAKQKWQDARSAVARATQVDIFRGAPAQQLGLPLEALGRVRRKAFFEEAEELLLAALHLYAEQASGTDAYQRQLFAADAARTLALVDLCRLRYDVVVMNPPFGAAGAASKSYLDRIYQNSKMDILAMFIDRALRRLKPLGVIGIISSRTGLLQSSYKPFRQEVLLHKHIPIVADLGGEVLEATVETAAYIIQNSSPKKSPTTFIRLLNVSGENKNTSLLDALLNRASPYRYDLFTDAFDSIPGKPLAYWAPTNVRRAYERGTLFHPEAGHVRQGLATADNFRFLRTWWEKSAKSDWFYFAKGGKWSLFYLDLHLTCNWKHNGKEIINFFRNGSQASRPQNIQYYFKPGLTYLSRAHSLCPQPLPANTIFSIRSQGVFPTSTDLRTSQEQNLINLAVLASRPFDYMLKMGLGFSARPQFDGGPINRTPFPSSLYSSAAKTVAHELMLLAKRGYDTQHSREFSRETSLHFRLPTLLLPHGLATAPASDASLIKRIAVDPPTVNPSTIAEAANLEAERAEMRLEEVTAIQQAINERAYQAYGFGIEDQKTIQEFYDSPVSNFTDDDESFDEDDAEVAAPIGIPADSAFALWQWLMGAVFGRWDVRFALQPSLLPPVASPFDALPTAPAGALRRPTDSHFATSLADLAPEGSKTTDYPIEVAWNGLLPQDPDHPQDISRQLRQLLALLRPDSAAALETESRTLLASARADLSGWLYEWLGKAGAGGFFPRHLNMYSRSNREAPIYWPLQAPGTDYILWLYAPCLSRDTLFAAMNHYLEPRRTRARDELRQLNDLIARGPAASVRESRERDQYRESLNKLIEGLTSFIQHLSGLLDNPGFIPHPDDGAVISACMLAELFAHTPWRRKLEQHRAKLQNGDYDWSHLAYALYPERVREKARQDRSLAIAHGIEDVYQGELVDLTSISLVDTEE